MLVRLLVTLFLQLGLGTGLLMDIRCGQYLSEHEQSSLLSW